MSEVKAFPVKGRSVAVKQAALARLGQAVQERERLERALARSGGPLPGLLETRIAAKQEEINDLAAQAHRVGSLGL